MATRSLSSPNDTSLGEDDLKELYEVLHPVRTRYYYIGLYIGVKSREILTIKAEHSRLDDRLREVLIARLKMTKALTWDDIVNALRSKMVGEPRVADRVLQRYGNAPRSKMVGEPRVADRVLQRYGNAPRSKMVGEPRVADRVLQRYGNLSTQDKQSEQLSKRAVKKRSESLVHNKAQCPDMLKKSEMCKTIAKTYPTAKSRDVQREIKTKYQKKERVSFSQRQMKKDSPITHSDSKGGVIEKKKVTSQLDTQSSSDSDHDACEGEETNFEYDRGSLVRRSTEGESVAATSTKTTRRKVAPNEEKGRKRRVKVAPKLPVNDKSDHSCKGRGQEPHKIQLKKRSRKANMKSSSIAIDSSSTLQGGKQSQCGPKATIGVNYWKENVSESVRMTSSSSESDDSSPECYTKNLTKEGNKQLRKVFKRFFGKLCCAITNPIEIAAQLQEKRLIPQSLMRDLMLSPKSQQAKTVWLVSVLHKKIKAHPDLLFLFIKLLLDSDDHQLQKTGGEMLRETGETKPQK